MRIGKVGPSLQLSTWCRHREHCRGNDGGDVERKVSVNEDKKIRVRHRLCEAQESRC